MNIADVLAGYPALAIAVSGGVDSLTLAEAAHRVLGERARVYHAISPAVAPEGTRRAVALAEERGWRLEIVDAGEFGDARYLANPVNRCYFCKSHLYDRIRELTDAPIASGANTDDLADYRPGLEAAAERGIVHPFITAGLDKASVRALARDFGLGDIAELPASPCLSSRVHTGMVIHPDELALVARVERALAAASPAGATLRCRITPTGVFVESEPYPPDAAALDAASAVIVSAGHRFCGARPYRRGAMTGVHP
ncbi:MAG: hypothetical protein LBR58_00075 [Propionibacteriaceae bacterium]|nr:hypothetical protein [Propionibacteriaceae bacterium]